MQSGDGGATRDDARRAAERAKPACLVVFRFAQPWNHHLTSKLALAYRVTTIDAQEIFLEGGSRRLAARLQEAAEASAAEVILFVIDYYYLFDCGLIDGVQTAATKVLVCFDDIVLHQINSINASVCDLVLTADPLSALKYREAGVPAEYLVLEGSKERYPRRNVRKDIDVLFFGSLHKADRRELVAYLEEKGLELHVIGPGGKVVPGDELANYICRARIVVNFAKTDYAETTDLGIDHARRYYLQFKGRVIEAGLCATACVSEYSPALRLLFTEREVPTFGTPQECYDVLTRLLQDPEACQACAERLHSRVMAEFEDAAQIRVIKAAIESANASVRPPVRVPLWYWKLALKSKIRMLDRSPGLVVREIAFVFREARALGLTARIGLVLKTCCWMPLHYARRLAARLGTPNVAS